MLRSYLNQLVQGLDLSEQTSYDMINSMLNDAASEQTASALMLLRAKGETPNELLGIVKALREHRHNITIPYPVIDIVGTGGDGSQSFNISTASALLTAACGVKVAKHGNRSVSSQCGSADVLEYMGITIEQAMDQHLIQLENYNFTFFYAPQFHPAFAKLKSMRKALAMPTLLNIIGPLLNPADAPFALIGVYDANLLNIVAQVLMGLGVQRAMVVYSQGMDELTSLYPAQVIEINHGKARHYELNPADFGFSSGSLEDLQGGNVEYNANIIYSIFSGANNPKRDTVVFNTAVALYIAKKVKTIKEGIFIAERCIDNGVAKNYVERLSGRA